MIEPVEVKFKNERSFHYVPIKQSLAALLEDVAAQEALIQDTVHDNQYLSSSTLSENQPSSSILFDLLRY